MTVARMAITSWKTPAGFFRSVSALIAIARPFDAARIDDPGEPSYTRSPPFTAIQQTSPQSPFPPAFVCANRPHASLDASLEYLDTRTTGLQREKLGCQTCKSVIAWVPARHTRRVLLQRGAPAE
jgi:hypothetical protein